jgi:hypothetical protein
MSNVTGYAVLGVVGFAAVVSAISYFSAASTGNRMEQGIKAQYEQDQNKLSEYSLKVTEAAQVPGLAKDHIIEVSKAAMQGRYGADGSKAVFQSIKEAYPGTVDPALYLKIQSIIESGRTSFSIEQEKLIDKKRVYETALGAPWQGLWLGIAGYPRINLDDYKIVKSDYSNQSFGTGVDSGVKIK